MHRVLIVLPVLNEEVVLEQSVRRLHAWCEKELHAYDWRICIADNGSTDRTGEISLALTQEFSRVSFRSIQERGRGRALSLAWTEGVEEADILAYMDIDLSTDLEAVLPLLRAVEQGDAVAYGSRFSPGARVKRSLLRETTSRGYRLLAQTILGVHAIDLQCGFKAVSRSAWEKIRDRVTHPGWFWDTELLFWAEQEGMKVTAIPVHWVETRDIKRKSTVRLIPTIVGYIRDLFRARVAFAVYRKKK